MTPEQQRLNQISEHIIGLAYKVSNTLGVGFLEVVYENAMAHELAMSQHLVRQQDRVLVRYDGIIVGDFRVDLVVDDSVLVEVKAVSETTRSHDAQLTNYLKAAGLKLGLILNFGQPKVQIVRKVNGF
jgi:GxxExxY protein